MPITRLENTSGTTIDLIRRRKIVERGCSLAATSVSVHSVWSAQPMSTPITIAMMIHPVSEMRRRKLHISMRRQRAGLGLDARQQRAVGCRELGDAIGLERRW